MGQLCQRFSPQSVAAAVPAGLGPLMNTGSLLKEHKECFGADELTEQLNSLFDMHAPGVPTGTVGDAAPRSPTAEHDHEVTVRTRGGVPRHLPLDRQPGRVHFAACVGLRERGTQLCHL